MLDLALLGLLSDQPLHGYELKKQLAEVAGSRAAVSFGALYPALSRLEKGGLVRTIDEPERREVPMTGSLGAEVAALRTRRSTPSRSRRTRKVYAVTAAGSARLGELLALRGVDDRTFNLQVAFCRHLPPADRLALFEARRAELHRRILDGDADPTTDRRRDRYRRAARDRETVALRAELAWLDRLIEDERSLVDDLVPQPTPLTGGSPR